MNSPEKEDWKKRLKSLGIVRKRKKRPKKDLLISLRTLQKVTSGREGEDLACALLAENSLQVLARNVRSRDGEIDIVALDGATTVFVEVKRRKNDALGTPAEAVTRKKRGRVIRAARRWLVENPGRSRAVRFDVVAIRDEPPEVAWIRGAFDASGA
ncbi:MAG TPA: YraN family protein [Thermoanaerobaculia bacterium]|nr:YraN family protein [Thermoanaerobaculia bacterium]